MGLRSLAKAKLSVLFENILNIGNHNGFAVTSWDCEQQRSPEDAKTALKRQIKKLHVMSILSFVTGTNESFIYLSKYGNLVKLQKEFFSCTCISPC